MVNKISFGKVILESGLIGGRGEVEQNLAASVFGGVASSGLNGWEVEDVRGPVGFDRVLQKANTRVLVGWRVLFEKNRQTAVLDMRRHADRVKTISRSGW